MSFETLAQVRDWYDRDPEFEWRRLEWRVQYRVEHLVTLHALVRHLPPPAATLRILDAGGGPGRYTIALAERGYRVTLLDLSPGNVALAQRKIAEAGPVTAARVDDLVVGSFTDLSAFANASFDAVLYLGAAFSHLVERHEQQRALAEFHRVARPEAIVFVSALNRFGAYRGVVQWPDEWDAGFPDGFPRFVETGYTDASGWPCYAFTPDEFTNLLADAGLPVERVYGAQGIAAHLPPQNLEALMADAERWPIWRRLLLDTCDHPSIVGVSAQLLAVARKGAAG
jgi:SAM-dependent methyltransferase